MDKEVLTTAADLGEIIRLHNEAVERLKAYRASRPYLMAPNLAGMLEGNLKDNVEVLYRELNNLTKPRSAQRQYVCAQCHSVFLQRLPGGICDECRSRSAPGAGRYGGGSSAVGSSYNPQEESDRAAATTTTAPADGAPESEAQGPIATVAGDQVEPTGDPVDQS